MSIKNKKYSLKKIILSLCLTGLLLILFSPIYTNMVRGFIESRTNNRAEIYITSEKGLHQRILEAKINSEWKDFKVEAPISSDDVITIQLTAESRKGIPLIVDYRTLKINDHPIFDELLSIQTDKPYEYQLKMRQGSSVKIEMQIRKHHFNFKALQETYEFDWSLFFSVGLLTFLASYKLIQYLSKFKQFEQGSRIDIVLVVVFAIILFLPMSHISHEEKSEKENRILTKYEPLIKNGTLNLKYGEQFEKWFNDRFFGRKTLINFYAKLSPMINKYGKNSKAGIYKEDWILNSEELRSEITQEQLKKINKGIMAYRKFCSENRIKCYIEIVPRKLEFIKDKTFRIIPEKEQDKAKIITNYVKEKQGYEIVYPFKELQKAEQQNLIFFKTDHHWTEWGAYIGYQALMKKIKEDFPTIKAVNENDYEIFYKKQAKGGYERDFNEGATCMLLHLKNKRCPLKVDYKYYKHKKEDQLHIKKDDLLANKDFYYPQAPNKQKVMIIGNSFIENFAEFSPFTFETLLNRRVNNAFDDKLKLSRWKDEIIKEKINIVIILISSEYSNHFADMEN